MVIFELKQVKKRVSDRLTLEIEHLQVNSGERIGIVGLNGAGKTSLLKLMLGELTVDSGQVNRRARHIGWIKQATTEQINGMQVGDESSLQQEKLRQRSLWNISDVEHVTMSGGELTRMKIAEVLAMKPDVLVADEPTTHLDIAAIQQLSEEMLQFSGTLLLISHDREFLDQLCNQIIEVEDGQVKRYSGNYSQYASAKQLEKEQAEAAYEQYVGEKKRLERTISLQRNRANKVTKAPKRMGNSEARLHKGGIKQRRGNIERNFKVLEARLARLEEKRKPVDREPVRFDRSGIPPLRSKWALRLENYSLVLGNRKLIDSFSCYIRPGMKVAIVGPNGAGKTSLLEAIVRQENIYLPDSAKVEYFKQKLDHLNMSRSLFDNIRAISSYSDSLIRTVLARLHFKDDEVLKPVAVLSGGEKVKAGLAMVFLSEANMLLLDEPTNYLDIFTQEELQEMVAAYPGTILFASHDRYFIQAVADHVIELQPETCMGRFYPLENSGREAFIQRNQRKVPADREASQSLEPSSATDRKQNEDRSEERLVLETELTAVLGQISSAQPGDNVELLEQRYEELLTKLKALD